MSASFSYVEKALAKKGIVLTAPTKGRDYKGAHNGCEFTVTVDEGKAVAFTVRKWNLRDDAQTDTRVSEYPDNVSRLLDWIDRIGSPELEAARLASLAPVQPTRPKVTPATVAGPGLKATVTIEPEASATAAPKTGYQNHSNNEILARIRNVLRFHAGASIYQHALNAMNQSGIKAALDAAVVHFRPEVHEAYKRYFLTGEALDRDWAAKFAKIVGGPVLVSAPRPVGQASVVVADNYGGNYPTLTEWDGTDAGKIAARKRAHAEARKQGCCAGFVKSETFTLALTRETLAALKPGDTIEAVYGDRLLPGRCPLDFVFPIETDMLGQHCTTVSAIVEPGYTRFFLLKEGCCAYTVKAV